MVVKSLVKLADSLDQGGHQDLADLVDGILKQYAHEMPEGEEEETECEEVSEGMPHDEHDEMYATKEDEMPGMLGDSWYGEGPQWDTTPIEDSEYAGSMLDHRMPLPTDVSEGAAPEVAEEEEAEEPEEAKVEIEVEAREKLARLAGQLDAAGRLEEADLIDKVLASLKK